MKFGGGHTNGHAISGNAIPGNRVAAGSAGVNGQTSAGAAGNGDAAETPHGLTTAAWLLAEAVIALRHNAIDGGASGSRKSPLADVGETSELYRAITSQPFDTISRLLDEATVANASAEHARSLRQRIDQLVCRLKEPGRN